MSQRANTRGRLKATLTACLTLCTDGYSLWEKQNVALWSTGMCKRNKTNTDPNTNTNPNQIHSRQSSKTKGTE